MHTHVAFGIVGSFSEKLFLKATVGWSHTSSLYGIGHQFVSTKLHRGQGCNVPEKAVRRVYDSTPPIVVHTKKSQVLDKFDTETRHANSYELQIVDTLSSSPNNTRPFR